MLKLMTYVFLLFENKVNETTMFHFQHNLHDIQHVTLVGDDGWMYFRFYVMLSRRSLAFLLTYLYVLSIY